MDRHRRRVWTVEGTESDRRRVWIVKRVDTGEKMWKMEWTHRRKVWIVEGTDTGEGCG